MNWTVLDEYETMRRVRDERLSLARYGDGEIKLCRGVSCKLQTYDPLIAKRLRNILKAEEPRCLVAIPNIWHSGKPPPKKFWVPYQSGPNTSFYYPVTYGSSFVSRPDSAPSINTSAYWGLVRSIWLSRPVILVTGAKKGRQFIESGMLNNAGQTHLVTGPGSNAWIAYEPMMAAVRQRHRDINDNALVILALGPTATVMAYHLAKEGIQALDLGHMGVFYRNWLEDREVQPSNAILQQWEDARTSF